MNFKYLKDNQYYYDQYDRHTIEIFKSWGNDVENSPKWNEIKDKKSREILKNGRAKL